MYGNKSIPVLVQIKQLLNIKNKKLQNKEGEK